MRRRRRRRSSLPTNSSKLHRKTVIVKSVHVDLSSNVAIAVVGGCVHFHYRFSYCCVLLWIQVFGWITLL